VRRPEVPVGHAVQVYLADANVLYSRVLRDYLLYCMRARLVSVAWSQSILDEMTEHLMLNRPGFTSESADRLARAMTVAFPYAQHDPGDAQLRTVARLDLPDPDDRHVVAAALAADASFICTHNTKDFPPDLRLPARPPGRARPGCPHPGRPAVSARPRPPGVDAVGPPHLRREPARCDQPVHAGSPA
jgi:predicted nucleic acid-binding protein